MHAAVNQIQQQRFVVTVVAVALFAAGLGYLMHANALNALTFGVTIVLLFVLAVLYFISHCLQCAARLHTSYLRLAQASAWERHLAHFNRRHAPRLLTIPHAAIFLLLGVLTGAWPFLAPLEATTSVLSVLRVLLLAAAAAYATLVVALAWRYRAEVAERIEQQWSDVLEAEERTAERPRSEPRLDWRVDSMPTPPREVS